MRTIKNLLGKDNIMEITFGNPSGHANNKKSRWCHIHCLSAAKYTEWLYWSTIMFERQVDFIPHKRAPTSRSPTTLLYTLPNPDKRSHPEKIEPMLLSTTSTSHRKPSAKPCWSGKKFLTVNLPHLYRASTSTPINEWKSQTKPLSTTLYMSTKW